MAETAISLDQLAGIEKIKQYLSDKGLDLPSDPNDIQAEWSVWRSVCHLFCASVYLCFSVSV